ncbi:hypothetical protein M9H77_25152 [Catharanthus roseus]|uniref:Uncharacterized protein n=1 Tax=Catharanthus roseus TaxID=4058 RepID=A0ACC0A6X6_CATRO|nr:hypothetical protein M9H77_25152 [Catharanthus roseus]
MWHLWHILVDQTGRIRHGKGKGLTGSFMSVMSKIAGSRNKRPEVAHKVPVPTQKRKKLKLSDWEQTGPAEGGPVDPELIPSYGGHDRGSLKFRSRYMALTSKRKKRVNHRSCRDVKTRSPSYLLISQ